MEYEIVWVSKLSRWVLRETNGGRNVRRVLRREQFLRPNWLVKLVGRKKIYVYRKDGTLERLIDLRLEKD